MEFMNGMIQIDFFAGIFFNIKNESIKLISKGLKIFLNKILILNEKYSRRKVNYFW